MSSDRPLIKSVLYHHMTASSPVPLLHACTEHYKDYFYYNPTKIIQTYGT